MYNRYSSLVLALLSGAFAIAKAPAPSRSAYEDARWQADAAATKWHTGANLYRAGLSFHARGSQSRFEYFFPERAGRWLSLTVSISPEEGLTTTEYGLTDPMPLPAPDALPDPLEAIDRLGLNRVEDLSIDLTRIGESNPTIYGLSRTALGQVARPGQWVWYVQTSASGGSKLVYIDALSGQGAAVCWSSAESFASMSCGVSK
jgi:hypothetical protein